MVHTASHDFLQEFAEAWNRHDTDGILSMMTSDCVMCLAAGPTKWGSRFEGQDAIRLAIDDLFKRMPDVQWQDPRHFVSSDRGVTEWTMIATTREGRRIEANGCDVFRFRDGRISAKDSYRKFPSA